MSDEPKTVEMHAANPLEVLMQEIRRDMRTGFEQTNANIGLVSTEVGAVQRRLGSLEDWRTIVEGRLNRNSDRAKNLDDRTSNADLSHEAAIASEIAKRRKLEEDVTLIRLDVEATKSEIFAQTDMLRSLMKNPVLQKLAYAAIAALTTWLATRGHS